jgi:uncharacterized protein (TIGR02217 family)
VNVFPSIPGYVWPSSIAPFWNGIPQKTVTGRVVAATYQQYPLYRFAAQFAVLAQADYDTLVGFFNQQQGNVIPFWFDAGPGNDSVTAQAIGVGDGNTKTFQLLRSVGGNAEPVAGAFGTTTAYVAGTAASATFNSPSNGYVTFASAPASGAAVTWSGNYYFQCRFSKGTTEFEQFMYQLYKTKTVSLETYW